MIKEHPFISVVIPVKNEALLLRRCLESLQKQDYPKDRLEIIIADGLSSDNTKEVALSFSARVVSNDRQIVVSGRNCGFKQAQGDIIAFTDADCVFDAHWLGNSIKYFQDEKVGGVGGVSLAPKDSTAFEKAVDFLFYLAGAFQASAHRKSAEKAGEVKDIPGCNCLYRREALLEVMPVDENLLTAEDVWMNFCIRAMGYRLILAPDVILWHYRRSGVDKFLRQVYRFAIGRLQAGKKNIKLLGPFHILAGMGIPIVMVVILLSFIWQVWGIFLTLALVFFLGISGACLIKTKSLSACVNINLVIILFIIGWSAGFLRELFFPLKEARGR